MALKKLFPTEIWIDELKIPESKLFKLFEKLLVASEDTGPTITVNSPLKLDIPEAKFIREKINSSIEKFVGDADFSIKKNWATIYRPGQISSLPLHCDDHYFTEYIAVFYLLGGETDKGGEFKLYDPRWINPIRFNEDKRLNFHMIEPKNGLLVVFPSHLFHAVSEYRGAEHRVSINIPVKLMKQKTVSPMERSLEDF